MSNKTEIKFCRNGGDLCIKDVKNLGLCKCDNEEDSDEWDFEKGYCSECGKELKNITDAVKSGKSVLCNDCALGESL